MDDALAHQLDGSYPSEFVLILVVMDDALAHTILSDNGDTKTVLILVVMDDALARLALTNLEAAGCVS